MLASGSPQRRALCELAGVSHRVVVSSVAEGTDPLGNARAKARAVRVRCGPAVTVLAADTEVVVDGHAQGKPPDATRAAEMLRAVAGREHEVVTAWVVDAPAGRREGRSVVRVRMRPFGEELVRWYVATGEWRGRAGGYAIQGAGGALVAAIEGDHTAVVGLPLGPVLAALAEVGQGPWARGLTTPEGPQGPLGGGAEPQNRGG